MRGQKKGKKKEELGRSLKKVAQRGKPRQRQPETEKEAHALVRTCPSATPIEPENGPLLFITCATSNGCPTRSIPTR